MTLQAVFEEMVCYVCNILVKTCCNWIYISIAPHTATAAAHTTTATTTVIYICYLFLAGC
jgi:O-antigen/teichoic acid export membrane protein